MGQASNRACPFWLQAVFQTAGVERGLLTREDLLLCTSSCKSWRFGLLAMLPPGTPSYEGLVRTRLDLSLKDLAWALRTGRREAQTMVTDFLRAHPGAVTCSVDPHHAAKNDAEAALEELLKHQPENVPVDLEQLLLKVVIDQAARYAGEAHRVYRKRLREWERRLRLWRHGDRDRRSPVRGSAR